MGFPSCLRVKNNCKELVCISKCPGFSSSSKEGKLPHARPCPLGNSSAVVWKWWVLTRLVKIAIRLQSCREGGKWSHGGSGQYLPSLFRAGGGIRNIQDFSIPTSGVLHFWVALVAGTKFHKERSLLMAFLEARTNQGLSNFCLEARPNQTAPLITEKSQVCSQMKWFANSKISSCEG